ncbi:hypothetical protein O3P69_005015 [Scylla paramamosain]|uniref:Uncharacterized protein n=1 Tax=Scylla paramamosain TaxID=85552 RepID=A0AAW0UB69_SCYPA
MRTICHPNFLSLTAPRRPPDVEVTAAVALASLPRLAALLPPRRGHFSHSDIFNFFLDLRSTKEEATRVAGRESTSGILRGLWDTALKSLPSVLVSGWRQQRRQQQRRPPPTPSTSRYSLTTAAQTQARPDPRPRLRARPPPSTTTATSSSSSTAATTSTATARARSLSCILFIYVLRQAPVSIYQPPLFTPRITSISARAPPHSTEDPGLEVLGPDSCVRRAGAQS